MNGPAPGDEIKFYTNGVMKLLVGKLYSESL